MKCYECINCGGAVRQRYEEGVGTVWTHVDGIDACFPRYASPNFNRPVDNPRGP